MDPNEALAKIRRLVERTLTDDEWDYSLELAESFDALDKWIKNGGFLPNDWERPYAKA